MSRCAIIYLSVTLTEEREVQMITPKTNEEIQLAIELYELQEARRTIEKREEELKDFFKKRIGNDNGMNAGSILILLEDCTRSSLDRKSLENEFGVYPIKRHEKVTHFKKFVVKRGA